MSERVDFAAFFAKHPLIPGGDEVLAELLREREENDPEFVEQMTLAREIMLEDRDILRELAKR